MSPLENLRYTHNMATITGYKTPTCSTCKVADKVADASGVEIDWVDLSENEKTLLAIKARLGKGPTDQIQVPLFEIEGSEDLQTIVGLRDLLAQAVA